MHHDAGDCVEIWFAGKIGELDVLKAVESKARGVGFAIWVAPKNVEICSAGFAKIFGHELAIGMKHFAVSQSDHGARGAFDFEANDACEILAEIEDMDIRLWGGDRDWFDLLNSADRQTGE